MSSILKYLNPSNWLSLKGEDPNKLTNKDNPPSEKQSGDNKAQKEQPSVPPNPMAPTPKKSNTSGTPGSEGQPPNSQQQPSQKPPQQKKRQAKGFSSPSFWIWFFIFAMLMTLIFSLIFLPSTYGISVDAALRMINLDPAGVTNVNSYWYYDFYIVTSYSYGGSTYILYFSTSAEWYAFTNQIGNASLQTSFETLGAPYVGPSFFQTILTTWLPWIVIMVVAWVLIKRITEKQGPGKIQKKSLTPQISNVKLENVAGYEEIKEELSEIVDFLKDPYKYHEAGARTPKGVLMSGPPGTGKTLFAKAVAGEASIPFYSISGSDFVEMFVGVGASRVRSLFEQAKKTAPALVFIDELDAVGRMRGAGVGGGNDEREQTLNQLLVEMDGFSQNSGIIVIAATNRPDVLDPALKRPGRFDRDITLRLPDIRERQWILESYVKVGNKKVSPKIDWSNIAQRTPGFSGAELENVVNEAAILSVRLKANEISVDIIDEAIDRVIGGPSKKNNMMSNDEKNLIAHHESGHALIGLVLADAEKVQKISIIPRGHAGGYVLMTPKKEKFIQTKAELLAKITSYMGGRASEEIFFGKDQITTGAHNDIQEATKIARRMVTEFGMSELGPIQYEKPTGNVFLGKDFSQEKNSSSKIQYAIDVEIRNLVDHSYKEALDIIRKNKNLVKLFAKALMIKETLNAEETEYIFKNRKLPDDPAFKKKTKKTQKKPVQPKKSAKKSGNDKLKKIVVKDLEPPK